MFTGWETIDSVLGLGKVVREETFDRLLTSVYVGFPRWKKEGTDRKAFKRKGIICPKTRQPKATWHAGGVGSSLTLLRLGGMLLRLGGTELGTPFSQSLPYAQAITSAPSQGLQGPRGVAPAFPFRFSSVSWLLHPLKFQPSRDAPCSFSLVPF